ncbi:hypothetical protein JAO85_04710 [Comamonas sp. NyZ500]|uniref:hypothetical protein n=1 Tax=Comamonas sp. NyZ500 TaxID=2795732 RepID=UPI00192ADB7B|nr:hypothetical protein [Comamonas sp. NyZ500]MBL5976565.1 hypothetical protein [Comamonas sp. NyZ500]
MRQTEAAMILQKTAKAQEELQPGSRQLPQRARSLLLLAGGKSMEELAAMLGSDHAALAQQLVEQGYLQLMPTSASKERSLATHRAPPLAKVGDSPATPALAPAEEATDSTPAINMAGTRMYLFDMCERLFANRHEALAQTLRTQLREARDLTSLRSAGISLLTAVEEYAGEERAHSLRERLAALLAHGEAADPSCQELQGAAA